MEEAYEMMQLLKEEMKNIPEMEPTDLPVTLFTKELQIMILDIEAGQPYCRQNAANFGKVINLLKTLACHHVKRTRENEVAIFGCSSHTVQIFYSKYQHEEFLLSDAATEVLQVVFDDLHSTIVPYFQQYNDDNKDDASQKKIYKPTLVSHAISSAMSYMKSRQRELNFDVQTRILFVSGSSVALGNLLLQRHVFKKAQNSNLAIDVCAIQQDALHELVKEVDLTEGYYMTMAISEKLRMFPINTVRIDLIDTLDIFKLAVRYRPLIETQEFYPDNADRAIPGVD